MQLNTKHFGKLEIDDEKIIDFPEGLPSFEHIKKYTLIDTDDPVSPFKWLQGIDAPELAFAVVNPFMVKKDYDIALADDVISSLDIKSEEDVMVYSIVVVPEDINKMTMNLKAPVIINTKNNKGVQTILDTDRYGVRHYILEELQRQEVSGNACTHKKEGSVHCHK